MSKNHTMDLTNGPVLGKMLRFSLPIMASGVLQLLFNAADIIVVGKFAGDNCMGAVGSTSALINLFTNLFIGLSVGVNVIAARSHGANSKDDMQDIVHTSILLSLFCGAALAVIGAVFAPQMLVLMETTENQLPLAVTYLRIYFIGMPAMMAYNFGAAMLRAIGDTKRPLYFLITAGFINVLLNLLFVIAFKMNVAGVALATVLSQCVSATLIIICLVKETGAIHLDFRKLKIHGLVLKAVARVGLPAGLQGTIFSLSNVVIQSSVNPFGDTVVSGNSAAMSIEGFIYMAMNTFYQAAISFTGQNVGAKKFRRIPRILLCAQCCVIVTGLVLGWAAYLLGRPLLSIYSDSDSVIASGMSRLAIISTTYALCGCMDVMVGMMRGIGYSIMPMIVSLIGACGLRILWIATVFQIPEHHKITTVYISYPITWMATLLAHIVCWVIVWHKLKKKQKNVLQ
ncbi:MAG: MATE family efflux transporter [Oscillospiraceae bacterium]|nr:MATE family efflux transporter [Oscillospiraceae bacterium]